MRLESISTEFGNRLRYRQKHFLSQRALDTSFHNSSNAFMMPSSRIFNIQGYFSVCLHDLQGEEDVVLFPIYRIGVYSFNNWTDF